MTSTTKYWPESVPRTLEYPSVSVGELLTAVCRRFADHVAIEDGEEQLTFDDLLRESSALAHSLRTDGLGPGDCVMLHLPNSRDYVVSYTAIQLAGAILSPANPLYPADSLRHQILDSAVTVVITHPGQLQTALRAAEGTDVRRILVAAGPAAAEPLSPGAAGTLDITTLVEYAAGRPTTPPTPFAGTDDIAHLAYTGGTTGVSKGVRLLQRNVVANVCQGIAWRVGSVLAMIDGTLHFEPLGRNDACLPEGRGVVIMTAPLFHGQALYNLLFCLASGAKIVIMGRFSPERMLELIESKRGTYVTGSPTMWHALLGSPDAGTRDLSSLKVVSTGAAPIDPETLNALLSLFPNSMISEGYGMTEAVALVTSAPGYTDTRRKIGSVGQPVMDTELEIRGEDGTVLAAGEHGELWIRGPQIADGYHCAEELTRTQFVDGWMRSGDIGYVDDEGFVFISDRIKDMLLYKGYNVYPRQLEDLLVQHPGVSAVAVVGRPDATVGQIPVAFVVREPGSDVDAAALQAYVAEKVLPYMKVREVHFVDALPSSAAGKILKTELRSRLT